MSVSTERLSYPVYAAPLPDVEYLEGTNLYRHTDRSFSHLKRPLVIYPPLGNTWIAIDHFFHALGVRTMNDLRVMAGETDPEKLRPVITQHTIETGVQNSPEYACLPLRVSVGFLIERLQDFQALPPAVRADYYPLFLGHESTGTCRERAYSRVQEARLQDFAQKQSEPLDLDFYSVKDSKRGVYDFVAFLLKLTGRWREGDDIYNLKKGIGMVRLMSRSIAYFNMAESFSEKVRYAQSMLATEPYMGQSPAFYKADKALQRARVLLASPVSMSEKKVRVKQLEKDLDQLVKSDKKREKPKGVVAITGEIFQAEEMERASGDIGKILLSNGYHYEMHSSINHYIHKFHYSLINLIKMGLAYEIRQWNPFYKEERRELAGRAGLSRDAAGHTLDIAALVQKEIEEILRNRRRYAGIIEVLPFECTPQTVLATIIDNHPNREKLNHLRVILDEQTGRAGLVTRVEAFLSNYEAKQRQVGKLLRT